MELPPLRQRHAEILPLARSFLQEFAQQNKRKAQGFTKAAEQTLLNYPWPGNIRELSNVVLRAVFNCNETVIDKRHLEFNDWDSWTLAAQHQQREKVLQTLIDCGFNKAEAAEKLGIDRVTLYRWIQRLGIPVIKKKPGRASRAEMRKGEAA
jgi:DNA-binding NtrC family response regulator